MNLSPLQLLREAIKAVPALKYALGVVGLVAVVAIVGALRIRPEFAIVGAVVTLVLMVALLVFARLTRTAAQHFLMPALVLMWSFLVLVIAAAGLLFTSTFFHWPINFVPPSSQPTNTITALTVTNTPPQPDLSDAIAEKLKVAEMQLAARDYALAWATLEGAARIQPGSDEVLNAQADTAMAWLRNLVVREPQTFTEVIDQLTPCLYSALSKAKGSRQADIQAHIGWAAFLRGRENSSSVDVDAALRKALAIDPQNTYANAMLGHRLLQKSGNVAEARRHFETALATKRDSEWVKEMWFAALRWIPDEEHNLELARMVNEMRKNGEALPPDKRNDLFNRLYWFGASFDYLTNLVHSLPAQEHLTTLEWLAGAKGWKEAWPQQKFVLAELKEQVGDWPAALELYEAISDLGSDYNDEISRAITRCKDRMARH